MKISDELREWAELLRTSAYTKVTAEKINAFADRIDTEMVELPRDADGVPVHLNDTVYDSRGYECHVNSMTLYSNGDDATVRVGDGVCSTAVTTYVLTHKRPDSWERIADEIEEADVDGCIDWADRIRRLAKESEHERE